MAHTAAQNIEHIGIALWRAAAEWKRRFAAEMAAEGYPWHAEARGAVLAHLGPSGRGQAQLTKAMGMTKQAVQQLVDQLEADGVVRRAPDPKDRRARRIELTELGREDFRIQAKVKMKIEAEYRQRLGPQTFALLGSALKKIAP